MTLSILFFGFAEFFDGYPIIGPTNNCAQGDKKYILQLVLLLSVGSWIFNIGEMMNNRGVGVVFHLKSK